MSQSETRHPKGFDLLPRRLLVEQGIFAAMLWCGFALTMLAIPIVVSFFRPIEVSSWVFGQSIIQWYVLAIGCYVGWTVFELHVAHGQSRAGFIKSAFVFVLLYSAFIAVLYTVTFFPEALLYHLMGWTQGIDDARLYDSPLDVPMVFLNGWLSFALWGAGGLFLGLAWYRSSLLGSLGIGFALLLAGIAGLGMANLDGPLQFIVREGYVPSEPNAGLAFVLHVACVAVLFAASWYCGRDMSIRTKAA